MTRSAVSLAAGTLLGALLAPSIALAQDAPAADAGATPPPVHGSDARHPFGGRDGEPGPGGHERRLAHVAEALGLDAQQTASVDEILGEQRTAMRELRVRYREQGPEGREAARAEAGTIAQTTRDKLAAVLTPEQLGKLDTLREERRDRGGRFHGGPAGRRPGPPPEAVEL